MLEPATLRRDRLVAPRAAMVVTGTVVIARFALITATRSDPRLLADAGGVMAFLESIVATAGLGYAAWRCRKVSGSVLATWTLFALALLFNSLGTLVWSWMQIADHAHPFPSVADPLYLALYPAFALGILLMPSSRLRLTEQVALLLEMGTAALGILLPGWVLGFGPALQQSMDSQLELVFSVAYPVSGTVLCLGLAVVVVRRFRTVMWRPIALLAAAMALKTATDVASGALALSGHYLQGDYLDLGWTVSMMLFALAGVVHAAMQQPVVQPGPSSSDQKELPARLAIWGVYLPYVGLSGTLALLLWARNRPVAMSLTVLSIGVVALVILMLARQILAFREHAALYRAAQREICERKQAEASLREALLALAEARDGLEMRVAERTTELSEANQALQTEIADHERAEMQIRASLAEKEVLLKEINHRVKNNLQVISSMLSLQGRAMDDARVQVALMESQHRVRSMALIHEKLYQSPDLAHIDLAAYIRNLAGYLFSSYAVSSNGIRLTTEMTETWMGLDQAVPCGLIINEIISNALKHAFPGGRTGEIYVGLSRDHGSRALLTIGDNGVGFPPGLDLEHSESLGLSLVSTLVAQLDGTIEIDLSHGTEFRIAFCI